MSYWFVPVKGFEHDILFDAYVKRTIVLVRSNVGEITYDGLWSNGPAWSASPQSEVSIMVFEPSTKK